MPIFLKTPQEIEKERATYLRLQSRQEIKLQPKIRRYLKEYIGIAADMYQQIFKQPDRFIIKSKMSKNLVDDLVASGLQTGKMQVRRVIKRLKIERKAGRLQDLIDLPLTDLGVVIEDTTWWNLYENSINELSLQSGSIIDSTTDKIISDTILNGGKEGLSVPAIAKRLRESAGLSRARALRIARTEVHTAANFALQTSVDQLNEDLDLGLRKFWLSVADERRRLTHRIAQGQPQNMKDPFKVGGFLLMYPGDTSLGAPSQEVVNCRCTIYYDDV